MAVVADGPGTGPVTEARTLPPAVPPLKHPHNVEVRTPKAPPEENHRTEGPF